MRILIGIDDTDNLESRGTGHRARQLGQLLDERGAAKILGITRHQLLVSPQIPYTSHNSSACLVAECPQGALEAVQTLSRDFLLADSAPGSDAGLCVAVWEDVAQSAQAFGERAKLEVLTLAEAVALAAELRIFLEGLTGTHGGVIGALAAVGLRVAGNDGRFLWLPGIRELTGSFTAREILAKTGIEVLLPESGGLNLVEDQLIHLGDWTRPILLDGKAVLLLEEVPENGKSEWRVIAKETIKHLSE